MIHSDTIENTATTAPEPIKGESRQQLLILYTSCSDITSYIIAWAFFDGTTGKIDEPGECDSRPYHTIFEALQDGWRVIQFPRMEKPVPDHEYDVSILRYEFVLEKLETVNHG